MSILSLPTELHMNTLKYLSFRDIIRCRALSKRFCSLVDSSKDLGFIIELGAAGTKDNANCPEPMVKKVDKLWQSNIAWANLHWLSRHRIKLAGSGRLFDVSEGVFFHSSAGPESQSGTTIEWFGLSSRRNPFLAYSPKKVVFSASLTEFAVDTSRDLIIGAELTSFRAARHNTITCSLYMKSISANKPHPSAALPILSIRFISPTTDFDPVVQICGNHVGILLARKFGVTNPNSFDMFLLLDWTTGISKAAMGSYKLEESWESFCFLTEDSVLIPSACNSLLNVYDFNDKIGSLKHAVSLLLPEPLTRDGLRHIYLRSQPGPSESRQSSHPIGDYPPFTADPDEAIIILSLDYHYHLHGIPDADDQGNNLPQVVAIPRRILTRAARLSRTNNTDLLSHIEKFHGRTYSDGSPLDTTPCCEHEVLHKNECKHSLNKRSPHLHAEQWIEHTRWGLDAVTPSMGCYAYGSRYLGMSSRISLPGAPASSIALYDFNLRNERRGCKLFLEEDNIRPYPSSDDEFINEDEDWDYDEETGEKRWPVFPSKVVMGPNTVSIREVFKKSFTTRLPYRVTETEMVLPWDSAVLDGERIIGLEFMDYEVGSISALDVIVI